MNVAIARVRAGRSASQGGDHQGDTEMHKGRKGVKAWIIELASFPMGSSLTVYVNLRARIESADQKCVCSGPYTTGLNNFFSVVRYNFQEAVL